MARKRKNADRNHDKKQHDARMVMDTYTAELPDNFIHQVLSLLSTKHAARAGILSKEWGHLWSSVPVLDFDEDEDGQAGQPSADNCKLKRKMFIKFMRRCLKRRGKDESNIEKFRLHMRYFGGATIVSKWLSLAVERNVKELQISFIRERKSGVRSYRPFYLPQAILNNAKSLTTLKLQNVTVKDSIDPISLPSLKTMSLKLVQFRSTLSFMHLISGCPSLEHFLLTSCTGLSDLKILSFSLKSLEVVDSDVRGIQVEAVNLESFKFHGNVFSRYMWHIFNIFSCQRVRCIELSDIFLTSEWCEGFNSSFPLLESLILHKCHWNYWEHIKIFSQNLKRFVFSDSEPIKPFFSMNFPNLSEARIDLSYRPGESAGPFPWNFYYLKKRLENFNCPGKVILHVTLPELCTFPQGIRNRFTPPLPSLKHLEVDIGTSTTEVTHSALMDFLNWMAPASRVLIHKTTFA
ncbi:F-box/FBD/LRR-repeat protein [Rosa sericea]